MRVPCDVDRRERLAGALLSFFRGPIGACRSSFHLGLRRGHQLTINGQTFSGDIMCASLVLRGKAVASGFLLFFGVLDTSLFSWDLGFSCFHWFFSILSCSFQGAQGF